MIELHKGRRTKRIRKISRPRGNYPMKKTIGKTPIIMLTFISYVGMLQYYHQLITTNQPIQGVFYFLFVTVLFGLSARYLIQLFGWKPPEKKRKQTNTATIQ